MCIAIYAPKGLSITRKAFINCEEANPDGIGIMYHSGAKIHVEKWLNNVNAAYQFYSSIQGRYNTILHFRIGTGAKNDLDNCHPFPLNNGAWLCHNGILSSVKPDEKTNRNDTRVFIDSLLNRLPAGWENNPGCIELIEKAIGLSNKFIILTKKGKVIICNEKSGHWKEGIWYSNNSYQEPFYFVSKKQEPKNYAKMYDYNSLSYTANDYNVFNRNIEKSGEEFCEYCGVEISKNSAYNGCCRECFTEMLNSY